MPPHLCIAVNAVRLRCRFFSLAEMNFAEKGMDGMYANCSTTAQRGALDWFKKFRDAVKPTFESLYKSVETGEETRRVLDSCGKTDYRQQLEKELKEVAESEMWRAGAEVRSLRPERQG